jgi:hypothetical protein
MGSVGRHKRRRRTTHVHDCKNGTGRVGGNDPTVTEDVTEDVDASVLEASLGDRRSNANQPQDQESTKKQGDTASHPNKGALDIDPLKNSQHQKVLADNTEDEILVFLAVLRQEKITNGKQGTSTNVSTEYNKQLLEYEQLSEFTLDFCSFSYKMNEFGTKTNRDSQEAIRQAESRASKKIVNAIMDAGDADQQRALALHRALLDKRCRQVAKSAGFKTSLLLIVASRWLDSQLNCESKQPINFLCRQTNSN